MSESLGTALPAEMERVVKLTEIYAQLGTPGMFALRLMQNDLAEATRALAEQDVVKMLEVYESLKGWTE